MGKKNEAGRGKGQKKKKLQPTWTQRFFFFFFIFSENFALFALLSLADTHRLLHRVAANQWQPQVCPRFLIRYPEAILLPPGLVS